MPVSRTMLRGTAVGAALLLAGCTSTGSFQERIGFKRPAPGDSTEAMARADEAYRQEEFEKAGDIYEDIADDTRQRPEVAEKARFYHAECLKRQGYYPKAVDAYNKLLQDFPSGLYRGQAAGQMYQIASEWLQPVRDEIEDAVKPAAERRKKGWADDVIPANFDRKLPTFASEDRALQALDKVYFSDPTGPTADKALFMLGRVHMHRQNYGEAARYFQQLVETCDKSPFRDDALKLAIEAKTNTPFGPDRDGRDTAEAMRLINTARATSPQLVREHGKVLDEQSIKVRGQQAAKDFETAEFYRRTGHPGSAWFCYELVKRRYVGIEPWYTNAVKRQAELKAELDDAQDPSFVASTRRFWKHYVLGHELPAVKNLPADPVVKDLPAPRPEVVPAAANVPADVRPR
ncbi:MAG TPA: tetratricopeptide repeat protein [Gemmataceae bacterium]|jgi:tetratricopeptide (TPR) repeat protein|nr:tetratricopeptide repeat protein [Gemmataceae bacterium]